MEHSRRWPTVLAAALVLPAVAFVAANVLKYGFGVDAVSNVLGRSAEPGEGALNVVVTALVLLAVLAGYLAAENAACRLGSARVC